MNNSIWKLAQKECVDILSDGIYNLLLTEDASVKHINYGGNGNYIIHYNEIIYYIGEAKNIRTRLQQQFTTATSTFYKNYRISQKSLGLPVGLKMHDFVCKFIKTCVGRKEMEEYGIVNLPAVLNRFQLDKSKKYGIKGHNDIWNEIQSEHEEFFVEGDKYVMRIRMIPWFDNSVPDVAGIYVVKNNVGEIIYIGESSSMLERFNTHTNRTYFSALRRHIGTEILKYRLKTINGRKRHLSEKENEDVNKYLKKCKAIFREVKFGRYELEDYMIKKYRPLLNRKGIA